MANVTDQEITELLEAEARSMSNERFFDQFRKKELIERMKEGYTFDAESIMAGDNHICWRSAWGIRINFATEFEGNMEYGTAYISEKSYTITDTSEVPEGVHLRIQVKRGKTTGKKYFQMIATRS